MLRAMWASRTVYMVRPSFGGGSTGRGPPCARHNHEFVSRLIPPPGDDRGDAELRLNAAMNGSVRVTRETGRRGGHRRKRTQAGTIGTPCAHAARRTKVAQSTSLMTVRGRSRPLAVS